MTEVDRQTVIALRNQCARVHRLVNGKCTCLLWITAQILENRELTTHSEQGMAPPNLKESLIGR